MKTYIYGLHSSADDVIRYVGRTVNMKKRLTDHIYYAKNPQHAVTDGHKNKWIRKTLDSGFNICIKLLEITDVEHQDEREMFWVSYFGRDNLTNGTDGGKYVGVNKVNLSEISFAKIKKYLVNNSFRVLNENIRMIHMTIQGQCRDTDYIDYRVIKGYSDLYVPQTIPITIEQYKKEIAPYIMTNVENSMLNYKKLFCSDKEVLENYYDVHYLRNITFIPETVEDFEKEMVELENIR